MLQLECVYECLVSSHICPSRADLKRILQVSFCIVAQQDVEQQQEVFDPQSIGEVSSTKHAEKQSLGWYCRRKLPLLSRGLRGL
jgi:hypothetical protein